MYKISKIAVIVLILALGCQTVIAAFGHDAANVRAGTFGSGNFIFPSQLNISGNVSMSERLDVNGVVLGYGNTYGVGYNPSSKKLVMTTNSTDAHISMLGGGSYGRINLQGNSIVITPEGYVGIWSLAPTDPLTIGGNPSIGSYWMQIAGGIARDYGLFVRSGSGATAIYGQGTNVGLYGDAAIGVQGYGTTNDFYAVGPGTDYGTSSSIRWKHNITAIPNALDKIVNMRGVYYTWDEAHGGGHGMGMIAEEVRPHVPEIVMPDANDSNYAIGMDYGHLTPVLVEAIKELKLQNDALKAIVCSNHPSAQICN